MPVLQPIPITRLIEALLDESKPFSPKFLYRLSDLEPQDIDELSATWPNVSIRRREALLEDLEDVHIRDVLQNYEAVARIALKDAEPEIRNRAISILREYELVDLLPTYIEIAQHDPDASVRANATAALSTYIYLGEIDELSQNKLKRVEEFLLQKTTSEDTKLVHRRAVEALGFSSRKEVVGLIEKAYNSGDKEWIVTALFAMGRSANTRWKSHVLGKLEDTQPEVRAEAAGAAGELEIKEATPILLELLDDTDIDVRMAAIWSLSQIGGNGVREALENQLESTDDDEEADLIENALDNLEFTDEMRNISLLEIPGEEIDDEISSEDDDEYGDDFISEDGNS